MGSRTIRNVAWNFAGQGFPMVVAVFTIPFLIERLGTDRFGILSIGWIVVGYLSVFDFGLGRAMTRQIAITLGEGAPERVPAVFWTAITAMAALGLLAAVLAVSLAEPVVTRMLEVPAGLEGEATRSLIVLAIGLPVTIVSTGLLGVLEAHQQFRLSGTIRLATGLATYIIPAAIAVWTADISIVVLGLVAARAAIAVASALTCLSTVPSLRRPATFEVSELRGLLQVGGWMTVSNVISPLMVALDRFFLGALISVAAISYYVTPADALTKALVLPIAVTGVLFPAFASAIATDRAGAFELFRRGWDVVFLTLLPFVLVVVVFASPALELWINEDFADRSTAIARWIAFGVLLNGLAQVPFWMLQATGGSRVVAMIHLAELPVYIVSLWLLVERYGITGAAVAWTLRVGIDLMALLAAARDMSGAARSLLSPIWRPELALVAYAVALAVVPMPLGAGAAAVAVGVLACAALLVFRVSGPAGVFGFAGAGVAGKRESWS